MKPITYINLFAGIAATALCLHIFSSFWLPLAIGACVALLIAFLCRK